MSKYALLCPGQGAQSLQMFDLAKSQPEAAAFLDEVKIQIPQLFQLSAEDLFENRWAQPLMVAGSLANWTALRNEMPTPTLIAGYSIGEISAHAISGAIDFHSAIALAQSRARFMDEAAECAGAQGLLSVSGFPELRRDDLLSKFNLKLSIVTGEQDFIVGGLLQDLEFAFLNLQRQKIACSLLPVKIASHTDLMSSASGPFKRILDQLQVSSPRSGVRVIAGTTSEKVQSPERLRSTLLAQLDQTIRWRDCMDRCEEEKIQFAFEIGPGSTLSKMFQKRHPHIPCRSMTDFKSVAGAHQWIKNQG